MPVRDCTPLINVGCLTPILVNSLRAELNDGDIRGTLRNGGIELEDFIDLKIVCSERDGSTPVEVIPSCGA
jgi:hypothetical protein